MTTPATPAHIQQKPSTVGGARLPSRPSFANALRQRGLLGKAMLPGGMSGAWSGAGGTWLAVSSIYEAHLRRVLMEQALETLRGDATS
jgi:hypothetical protein